MLVLCALRSYTARVHYAACEAGRARTAAAAADLCDDPCTNATRTLYFDGVNGRRADLREMASSRARSLIIGEAPYMILVRAR